MKNVELLLLSNNIKINNRQEYVQALADAYSAVNADVLTLQEVDDNWHETLGLDRIMAELGYSMVPVPVEFGNDLYGPEPKQANRNPIYYKTDKLELLNYGKKLYDAFSFPGATKNDTPLYGYRSYSYTWALLMEKTSSRKFVAISTHLNAGVQHDTATQEQKENAATYRWESARELTAAMTALETEYQCPVIAAGDFNSVSNSGVCWVMESDWNSARNKAEVTANMEYRTVNKFGSEPVLGDAIDHCFFSRNGIVAKRFETLLQAGNVATYSYSDHVPIRLEFTLTG